MSIKSTIAAATLAALTLAAVGGEAQARAGWGLGLAFGAGAVIGAAAVSNAYAAPAYVAPAYAPGYASCRFVERIDYWGNRQLVRVCDVVRY